VKTRQIRSVVWRAGIEATPQSGRAHCKPPQLYTIWDGPPNGVPRWGGGGRSAARHLPAGGTHFRLASFGPMRKAGVSGHPRLRAALTSRHSLAVGRCNRLTRAGRRDRPTTPTVCHYYQARTTTLRPLNRCPDLPSFWNDSTGARPRTAGYSCPALTACIRFPTGPRPR